MSIKNIEEQNPDKNVLIVLMIPGVQKKLYMFLSLFFDVMWSKYYKILRGCSGIIF